MKHNEFADVFENLHAAIGGLYTSPAGLLAQQQQQAMGAFGGSFSTSGANAFAFGPMSLPQLPPLGLIQDPVLESERDWLRRRVREVTALAPRA